MQRTTRTPVDYHSGLKTYRLAREIRKRQAIHRKDILAQNPNIDPVMLHRLVKTRMEKDRMRA